MDYKLNFINRKSFIFKISQLFLGAIAFISFPLGNYLDRKSMDISNKLKISKLPESGPWHTIDPFLFCVHHNDNYPLANNNMGPNSSLDNRNIGNDFSNLNGWSMYHGEKIPGFPRHPHRGFETITIVDKGLIDHSDSLGFSARYGDGDVQWLTAGDGIQHSEMFPLLNTKRSNPTDFFQIWINLKSDKKRVSPNFSMFWKNEIPKIEEFDKNKLGTEIELIAGEYDGYIAPTPPPNSWAQDKNNFVMISKITMESKAMWKLPEVESGVLRTLYIYDGSGISINNQIINSGYMVEVNSSEDILIIALNSKTKILLLQAKPINEPVVKYGPFVMNTRKEIEEAFRDYNKTSFGDWAWNDDGPVHGKEYKKFAIGDN
jgi:quercetin 2,3-dioxygenase